ncbi:hypothetical protein [Streptomyces sp. NPDC005438]|uniref:hypothetical protein n=1 Tax=Streptomyces sp. NPDC005438 TaxID=3156880 RepID=UPI00339F8541
MTADQNGTGSPEPDDPFAHLYRREGGTGEASTPQASPARRSYQQVHTVGQRQYGNRQHQQSGVPHQQSGSPSQQSPNAYYAAPETQPGGRAAARQRQQAASRSSKRNGPLIAAIAVVAAVVMGIGAAMAFNSGGDNSAKVNPGPETSAPDKQDKDDEQKKDAKDDKGADADDKPLPQEDAATLSLQGGPKVDNNVPGAEAKGGNFVANFNHPGASATWSPQMDKAGVFHLHVRFGVPGKDMNLTLTVNGKKDARPVNMKNFAGAKEGDWEKGWASTYQRVDLKEGPNEIKLSCEEGNACEVNLDKVWLAPSED